jgi:hypothetical protein
MEQWIGIHDITSSASSADGSSDGSGRG